jgi:hypothetical protein
VIRGGGRLRQAGRRRTLGRSGGGGMTVGGAAAQGADGTSGAPWRAAGVRTPLLAALCAGLAALAAGCGGPAAAPVRQAPPGDHWYTMEDQRLAEAIRQALIADPALTGLTSAIGIDVQGGAVRLTGTAPTAAAKAEAGVCARWQAGPDQVQNVITVVPPPPAAP